jgi:phage terminase large subunit-like protein
MGAAGHRGLEEFDADRIVAEVNNGGEMVEATVRMVDENVPFKAIGPNCVPRLARDAYGS